MLSIQGASRNMIQRFQEAGNVIGEKPHLRDWSEVLMLSAAIYCLRAAVLEHKKNTPPIKNGNLWVFGTLSIAELRIRQLWITATLDDEAKKFKQDNLALRGEIEELTARTMGLKSELTELKGSESSLRNENTRLSESMDHMKNLQRKESLELQKFRETVQKLFAVEDGVEDAADHLTFALEKLQNEKAALDFTNQRTQADLKYLVDQKKQLLQKESDLNSFEERLTALQISLAEKESDLNSSEERLKTLQSSLAERESDLNSFEGHLKELQSSLAERVQFDERERAV